MRRNSRVFMCACRAHHGSSVGRQAELDGVPVRASGARGLKTDRFANWCSKAPIAAAEARDKPRVRSSYARSILRTKAMESNVLIGLQMNGRDLTPVQAIRCANRDGHTAWVGQGLTDIGCGPRKPFQGYGRRRTKAIGMIPMATPVRRFASRDET